MKKSAENISPEGKGPSLAPRIQSQGGPGRHQERGYLMVATRHRGRSMIVLFLLCRGQDFSP